MSLILPANFCTLTDLYAGVYKRLAEAFDAPAGIKERTQDALDFVIALNDYDQIHDMMESYKTCRDQLTAEQILLSAAASVHNSLQTHINRLGSTVDSTITSIETYANYYNLGPGGVWLALVAEHFALFTRAVTGTQIAAAQCFAYIPSADQVSPGMGRLLQGAPDTFTDGVAYGNGSTDAKLRVEDGITSGSGSLVFKVTGKNHLGSSGVVFHATVSSSEFAAGSEVDITPDDGVSRLMDVTAVELESGTWTTGAVYVKPVQERLY